MIKAEMEHVPLKVSKMFCLWKWQQLFMELERLGKEETEEFVKNAFFLSEQGLEAIREANTIVDLFGELKKQGGIK